MERKTVLFLPTQDWVEFSFLSFQNWEAKDDDDDDDDDERRGGRRKKEDDRMVHHHHVVFLCL